LLISATVLSGVPWMPGFAKKRPQGDNLKELGSPNWRGFSPGSEKGENIFR